ncbi:uncharacterized protein EV420DRAFT_1479681 [Desarmillaria tabescens]|uniref:Uncharacterized protein n=1 Tax=Armillaria tabescens TaxID=1929756 RepID=A0AA39KC25_ARMTA|nr:uncharacterized protein EV420DRAFT_1479681 [Desarmillaria tabescens]KAK0458399.1 hypothetical protein EV420DRAFT_1479681 [Desarmillaria tabescens]
MALLVSPSFTDEVPQDIMQISMNAKLGKDRSYDASSSKGNGPKHHRWERQTLRSWRTATMGSKTPELRKGDLGMEDGKMSEIWKCRTQHAPQVRFTHDSSIFQTSAFWWSALITRAKRPGYNRTPAQRWGSGGVGWMETGAVAVEVLSPA